MGRLRRLVDLFPLTLLGIASYVLLVEAKSYYWVQFQDRVVCLLAECGRAFILGSATLTALVALWCRLRLRAPAAQPIALECGTPHLTGLSLARVDWLPLVEASIDWESVPGAAVELVPVDGWLAERVTFQRRAFGTELVRRVAVSNGVGLARVAFRVRAPQAVRILPWRGQVSMLSFVDQATGGEAVPNPAGAVDGDLIEIRKYVPGDPLKLVLWKMYAKVGKMMVRTPERASTPKSKLMAYFVAGDGDEPSAGVARGLIEAGRLSADLLFSADGEATSTWEPGEAVDQIVRSARPGVRGGEGLGRFLEEGQAQGLNACILFVPPRPGPWLERVCAQVRRYPLHYRAIIGVDGYADISHIVESLRRANVEPSVVDRITGASLAGATA